MKICTQTERFDKFFGIEETVELLAKAGFDSLDYSMFFPLDSGVLVMSDDELAEKYTRLRKLIEDHGMYVYQTHTPFPTWTGDDEKDEVIFRAEVKALYISSLLGARHAVVHPPIIRENRYGSMAKENKELAVRVYSRLIPYLDKYNVQAAVENMFNWDNEKKCICPTVCSSSEEMADYVDTLNSLCGDCVNGERFVACLDVGHANLVGDELPRGDVRDSELYPAAYRPYEISRDERSGVDKKRLFCERPDILYRRREAPQQRGGDEVQHRRADYAEHGKEHRADMVRREGQYSFYEFHGDSAFLPFWKLHLL